MRRLTMWVRAGGVVAGTAVAGCLAPNLSIPPDLVIRCETDEICPRGRRCSQRFDRCVDASDETPPGVVAASAPESVGLSGVVRVLLEVDELLGEHPEVWLDVGGSPSFFTLDRADFPVFEYVWEHTGDIPPGSVGMVRTLLVDWAENESTIALRTLSVR